MRPFAIALVVLSLVCQSNGAAAQQSSTSEESSPVDRFVSQSTGDAIFQIPIPTPLGTGGFQPQLSLRYSSSAGDGPFGIGWQLPLGEIRRSTRFGIPTFDANDRFELDGELLVGPSAGEFRLATESFARITYDASSESWLVEYPNGSKARYGMTDNSRIRRDGETGAVFRWLPSELEDANHNVVRLSYDRSDEGTAYPKEIIYTYRDGALVGGIERKIEFVLDPQLRPDPLLFFTGSVKTQMKRRVEEVRSTVGGAPFRRLVLSYSQSTQYTRHRSRLVSAQLFGADCALDQTNPASGCVGMPPQTFEYGDPAFDVPTGTASNWSTHSPFTAPVEFTDGQDVARGGDNGVRIGDVNGDGRADLVQSTRGQMGVWLHNGNHGWSYDANWTSELGDLEHNEYLLSLLDDEIDEDPEVYEGGCTAELSVDPSPPPPRFSYPLGGDNTFLQASHVGETLVRFPRHADLIDINGDGRADIVVSMERGAAFIDAPDTDGLCSGPQITQGGTPIKYVWINNGTGWELDSALSSTIPTLWSSFLLTADLPGPRRVKVKAPSLLLFPNDGNNGAPEYDHQTFLFFDDHGGRYADLNGDGRLDLLFGRENAHMRTFGSTAYLNTPSGWVEAPEFAPPAPFLAEYRISPDHPDHVSSEDTGLRVVDLNGDGLADLVKTSLGPSQHPPQEPIFASTAGVWLNTGRGWCNTSECDAAKYTPTGAFTHEREQDAFNGPVHEFDYSTAGARIPISTEMSFVDLNADGKVDLLRSDGWVNDGLRAWLQDPSAASNVWVEDPRFAPPVATTADESEENNTVDTGTRMLDLDLDGALDFVRSDDHDNDRGAWLSSTRYADRVASHANGLGAVFDLTYALAAGIADQSLTSLARQDATALGENIAVVTWPQRPVVGAIDVSGIDIAPVTHEYTYAEPRWCPSHRSSLGFRATQTTNNRDQTLARAFFWQKHGRAGRPSRVEQFEAGNLLRQGKTTWVVLDGSQVGGSIAGAHVGRVTSKSTQSFAAGAPGALHKVEFGFSDTYGFNFIDSIEINRPTSPGNQSQPGQLVTRIPESADTYDWVAGLAAEETQTGSDGTIHRRERFDYKPDTALVTRIEREIRRREPAAPLDDTAITDRVYDDFGNLRAVIETHTTGSWRMRSFCYDGDPTTASCPAPSGVATATHTVPRAVLDPLGGVSTFEADLATGSVRAVHRFNGDRVRIVTDRFGRIKEQYVQPSGHAQETRLEATAYFDWPALNPSGRRYIQTLSEAGDGTTVREAEYFDGLGRTLRSVYPTPQGFTGRFVTRDHRGRPTQLSHDVDCGGNEHCSVTPPATSLTLISYDGIDRPLVIDTPESGILVNAYGAETREAPAVGPNGAAEYTTYDVVLSKDGNGNLTRNLLDGQRVAWVEECEAAVAPEATSFAPDSCGSSPATTFYTYEPTGEVSSIYDASRQYTSSAHRLTYIHDTLGNVREIRDPDGGVTTTTYYHGGEVESITNARGQVSFYSFDVLGRLTDIDAPADEHDTVISYDPHTRNRSQASKGGGVIRTQHFYDDFGREERKIASVLGTSMLMDFEHDLLGRTKKVVYPESTSIHYVYAGAYLEKVCEMNANCSQPVTTWVSDVDYDGLGRERELVEPPGTLSFEYDSDTYRLERTKFRHASSGQDWLNLGFSHDPLGNVQSITDTHNGPGQDNISAAASYTYDRRNRLESWDWNGAKKYFRYDSLGNLTHKAVALDDPQNLMYANPNRPHQVTQHVTSSKAFEYDPDGNVMRRGGQYLKYDSANQLVCVGSSSGACDIAQYAYDADGVLIAETGGGTTRLYFEDLFIWEGGTGISTVFALGRTLGERHHSGASLRTAWLPPGWEPPVDPWLLAWLAASAGGVLLLVFAGRAGVLGVLVRRPASASVALGLGVLCGVPPEAAFAGGGGPIPARRWTYHDHLGNRVLYLNDTPELIYRRVFEPFGGVAAESLGTAQHERIFTGKREDVDTRVGSESGLIHFGARWYDAEIGRFLSIDPIVQDVGDPQTHNPYGYVRNNPINAVDPDGREWFHLVQALGIMIMAHGVITGAWATIAQGAWVASQGFQAAGEGSAALVFGIASMGTALMGSISGGSGQAPLTNAAGASSAEGGGSSILPELVFVGASAGTNAVLNIDEAEQSKQEEESNSDYSTPVDAQMVPILDRLEAESLAEEGPDVARDERGVAVRTDGKVIESEGTHYGVDIPTGPATRATGHIHTPTPGNPRETRLNRRPSRGDIGEARRDPYYRWHYVRGTDGRVTRIRRVDQPWYVRIFTGGVERVQVRGPLE
jgi:RHS repeat-associated protein